MTIDEVLCLLRARGQRNLNPIQELVLRQAWKGQTYAGMAKEFHYDANYLKNLAAELWHGLSEIFEMPVTKTNFRIALEDRPLTSEQRQEIAQFSSQLSQTPLEFPSGPVPLNSPFYIDRPPVEELAYREIAKPGSVIRLKAPRLMGKSSLLLRILDRATRSGYRTVSLDFQEADAEILASFDGLLRWVCTRIARQLDLPSQIDDYWDEEIGSKVSCTHYLQQYLLARIDSPLVLALNEVNRVFEYPNSAREFLPLLRFWHEQAKQVSVFQKLRLVVVYNTEAYIPLNMNQSPFNVGRPIQLPEFSPAQVAELVKRHGLSIVEDDPDGQQLQSLLDLLGGHPYLVRLALYHLCHQDVSLEQLLLEAPTQAGIYGDRLRDYWAMLLDYPELSAAMEQVVSSDEGAQLESIVAYKLESMGLVKLEGNCATPSCPLYRLYFRAQFQRGESTLDRLQKLERENQELQRRYSVDELTQLVNRRGFEEFLQQQWGLLARENAPLSLIFCDLDYLRFYNKAEGEAAGDRLLQQVAEVIRQIVRQPYDLAARYGGEEFAILLPKTEAAGAVQVAERIRERVKALGIERDYQIGFPGNTVTVSLGVACQVPNSRHLWEDFVRSAQTALERSKQLGRDRVTLASNH
ncbi:MAG TPA: AAA-like domain-containing protein [Oscillatoriales cyanobacterium M59_W2019_021]|nr:AAA-like domain-containing protein [Oscillatoriales cyanobacterium M59_W2019_021]